MARGRIVSKSLSCSRRFNALTDRQNGLAEFTQLLFTLLIPHTDDFGRMTGDPFSVKMTVLPASPRPLGEFIQAMRALHEVELITVYQSSQSDIWLQVNKFDNHQTGLHKRTTSHIPEPKKSDSGTFPEFPGNSWSRARAEENGTEGKGIEEKGRIPPTVVVSNMGDWMNDSAPLPISEHTKTENLRRRMAQTIKRPHGVHAKKRIR